MLVSLHGKILALQLAHSRAYSMAWEMCMVTGYDSFSEIPQDELDGEDCKAKE